MSFEIFFWMDMENVNNHHTQITPSLGFWVTKKRNSRYESRCSTWQETMDLYAFITDRQKGKLQEMRDSEMRRLNPLDTGCPIPKGFWFNLDFQCQHPCVVHAGFLQYSSSPLFVALSHVPLFFLIPTLLPPSSSIDLSVHSFFSLIVFFFP